MNASPDTAPVRVPIELRNRAKAASALLGWPLQRFAAEAIEREIQRAERLRQRRRDGAA